jgi:peptidoglycan/xylan/chitin deacetylase (PgdA/CDA1 family)
MTFDDGPHAANTPRLLDMLKERHIHATFFMCGENVVQYPQTVKRMIAEGHEVANHSWNHPQLSKMNDEAVRSQFQRTQDAIVAACGVKPVIMRPPYGAFTERQQRWAFGEFGYKCILWDVDPLDWKVRNAAHVQSEILKQTVAGSIVLSHDIHKTTVDAMPATLDALAAKGFKFVTVSDLIAMDHPAPAKPKTATAGKKGAAALATPAPSEPAAPPTAPSPAAPAAPAPAAPTVTLPPALRGSPR